jgi:hypothetical protein
MVYNMAILGHEWAVVLSRRKAFFFLIPDRSQVGSQPNNTYTERTASAANIPATFPVFKDCTPDAPAEAELEAAESVVFADADAEAKSPGVSVVVESSSVSDLSPQEVWWCELVSREWT